MLCPILSFLRWALTKTIDTTQVPSTMFSRFLIGVCKIEQRCVADPQLQLLDLERAKKTSAQRPLQHNGCFLSRSWTAFRGNPCHTALT